MLVHITPSLSVYRPYIISMTLRPGPITEFRIKGHSLPVTSKGNWPNKLEKAAQVGAIAVYPTHHVLRS